MPNLPPSSHSYNPAPGWRTGDFHAHTHFSDGIHPPDDLLAIAVAENMDFLAITDHNTIGALSAFMVAPGMPILRGIEITLKIGHFNVFGVASWPDWLDAMLPGANRHLQEQDWQDANALMRRCKAEGWLVSINHPLLPPWDWKDPDTLLEDLDALEIWNDPTWSDNSWANPAAVAYWTRLLNAGYRITALGGSDYHKPVPEPGPYKPRLSLPRTYVYTENLSADAILEAVRQRRAIVGMGETKLAFTAEFGGRQHIVGADLGRAGGRVEFRAEVETEQKVVRLQLLKNGEVLAEERGENGRVRAQWQSQIDGAQPAWFRCDVRDEAGDFLALTNPFFCGPRLEPDPLRFGDFVVEHNA